MRGKKKLTFIANKVRQRRYFTTGTEANAEKIRQQKEINAAGADWVALKAQERADIISILREVQEKDLTLRQVWLEHQEFSKTLGNPILLAAERDEVASF